LNSFRRNERVSSSLKWAAFLAAWALVSPWAFSAPAEGPQPDAGPQTQNMLGQTLKEHKEAMPVAPDTGDFWKDALKYKEAIPMAPDSGDFWKDALKYKEAIPVAPDTGDFWKDALKYKEAIPVAPDSGDFWEDALKSYMKELEKANRERERMLEEYNEQMNRMLEEMGREPFDNWPPANINPRMFRHPAAESDLEAHLERLEKGLQSLERPETVQPGAAASPTLEENPARGSQDSESGEIPEYDG